MMPNSSGGDDYSISASGLGGEKSFVGQCDYLLELIRLIRGGKTQAHREIWQLGDQKAIDETPSDSFEHLDRFVDRARR